MANFLVLFIQKEPTAEFLSELRSSILETVDTNKDGRIELGEFAQ